MSVNTLVVFTSQYLNTLFNFSQIYVSFMVLWHMIIFGIPIFETISTVDFTVHGSLDLICWTKNFNVFFFIQMNFGFQRNLWESIQLQRMLSIQKPEHICFIFRNLPRSGLLYRHCSCCVVHDKIRVVYFWSLFLSLSSVPLSKLKSSIYVRQSTVNKINRWLNNDSKQRQHTISCVSMYAKSNTAEKSPTCLMFNIFENNSFYPIFNPAEWKLRTTHITNTQTHTDTFICFMQTKWTIQNYNWLIFIILSQCYLIMRAQNSAATALNYGEQLFRSQRSFSP